MYYKYIKNWNFICFINEEYLQKLALKIIILIASKMLLDFPSS